MNLTRMGQEENRINQMGTLANGVGGWQVGIFAVVDDNDETMLRNLSA